MKRFLNLNLPKQKKNNVPKGLADDATTSDPVRPERSAVLALAQALCTSVQFHAQMGIESYPLTPGLRHWLLAVRGKTTEVGRSKVPRQTPPVAAPPLARSVPLRDPGQDAATLLQTLHQEIAVCHSCDLASTRQGWIAGSGVPGPPLFVLGDYSRQEGNFSSGILFGEEEDALLWKMLGAIGVKETDVYVTNLVKCCPPSATEPSEASIRQCHGYLAREIEIVRPRVICALGDAAASVFLGAGASVFRLRGRLHPYQTATEGAPIQVMATFHPRLLLKHEGFKKGAWQDLQLIQRQLMRHS
jgi:uracil-DNA glycosylase family 4